MTTATITFIEAIRTKDIKIRNILNLETCISIVAAFFYGMFMKKINVKKINYKDININRYVDWSITTPIMLLVLVLAFCYNNKKKVTLQSFLIILFLNYSMLLCGFLGENGLGYALIFCLLVREFMLEGIALVTKKSISTLLPKFPSP